MTQTLFARLFVSLAKLMTAEKMKLQQFCQPGEYLAYKVRVFVPFKKPITKQSDVEFEFTCEIEKSVYTFTNTNIKSKDLTKFETHLSTYLNILFDRKQDYEKQTHLTQSMFEKLTTLLTKEEQQLLATQIDVNSSNVLAALGVKVEN